jgi:amidohydrolase
LDTGKLKDSAIRLISRRYKELAEINRQLHDNPEVAFKERRSSALLVDFLAKNNFKVEKGICKLPTAFRAVYGNDRPAIAFLAEYDALPKLGHACGHNLIATSTVAAALASCKTVDTLGGSVIVFGTPGEELYGGKVIMADAGAFDNIDIAMITHPGGNRIMMNTLACATLHVEFIGRAAHAAALPEAGINALEAMIQSFNAINSLRQHIRDRARIHGIITDGGEAANIIPAHTAATFMVRAENDSYLEVLKEKVINCFTSAEIATGAELKYRWGEQYAAMINNLSMARLFQKNIRSLGHRIPMGDTGRWGGSTDVGNVSRIVPTIQPLMPVGPDSVMIHTPEFTEVSGQDKALRHMLDAARAMAMTAIDLLSRPETMEKVRKESLKSKKQGV